MKNLFLFAVVTFFIYIESAAQVPKAMPPDANEFYNKSMPLLRPKVRKIVVQNAAIIKHTKINADSLSKALHGNPALKGMSNDAIEGVAVLVMVQASKDADEDLKKMVLEISRRNDRDNTSSGNNEKENSQLQVILDQKSGIAEEISYAMQKISGTQQDIINKLK